MSRLAALNTTFGRVVICLLLGVFCGLFLGDLAASLEIFGRIYVALLQMTVLPYVMVTLIGGIGRLEPTGAARIGIKAGLVIVALWVISWLTVMAIPLAYPEWTSGSFFSTSLMPEPVSFDLVKQFVPANIFEALSNAAIPAVVIFSLAVGLALMTLPGKARILSAFEILESAFGRIASYVVKFAPIGIFAIAAEASGTLRLDELDRLKIYLGTYVAAWAVLGFVTLPMIVAIATPLSYGRVLRHARTAMLTAFAANTVLVVLPLIAEESKRLLKEAELMDAEAESTVDLLVPAAYSLPTAGTPISVAFILFAAWFAGAPLGFEQYPSFAVLGFMSSFGGMYVALPYMLDFYQVPADLFQLFVVGTVATSQLWSALAAMNGVALCLLGACAVLGVLRWSRLMLAAAGSLLFAGLVFWSLNFVFKDVLPDPDVGEMRLLSLQLIEKQVPLVETTEPEPLTAEDLARDRLEVIRARGSLRVGINQMQPPFAFRDARGALVGLDMELMHALAADLNVNLEIVNTKWDEVVDYINSGRVDLVAGGIAITPERALTAAFTRAYLDESPGFLVPDHRRKEFQDIGAVAEMPGLRLGIPPRYFLRQIAHTLPNADIVVLDSPQAFLRGEAKNVDALFMSAQMGAAWTLIYPQFTVVLPLDLKVKVPTALVVPDASGRFRDFMDTWLEVKIKIGAIDRYYRNWVLGQDARGRAPRWSIIRDVLGWVD